VTRVVFFEQKKFLRSPRTGRHGKEKLQRVRTIYSVCIASQGSTISQLLVRSTAQQSQHFNSLSEACMNRRTRSLRRILGVNDEALDVTLTC
jgi:hypothetical protein